jgi:hypothetical protein
MITIRDFLQAVEHRITGGSEYQWQCFGSHARYLDSEVPKQYSASIVFDTQTQQVYQADVCDYGGHRAYRWTHPDFVFGFEDEAANRETPPHQAWDEVRYVVLETPEDFLTKLARISQGQDYDTRVEVPLDLDDDLLFELMKQAHEHDITLNQMVERILTLAIEAHKRPI